MKVNPKNQFSIITLTYKALL